MNSQRKIIHVDMDAFYASVEQRDNPKYRGKPLVVGGSPDKRGAVAAASYEARKFGIHSAMPSRAAVQRCPHLIFAPPRFEVYREISEQIRSIFLNYTDLVEPLALDEAYLDVTENKKENPSATAIAREIKQTILQKTQLTSSAGVSFNKFLAKIASGMNKPDGLTVIQPDEAEAFIEALPIEAFYGVGRATAAKMQELGIRTGVDLKQRSERELMHHFGKVGLFYYQIARGIDDRPVNPNRIRKSIGAETSFDPDLQGRALIEEKLEAIAQEVQERLKRNGARGRTVTLKVKFADYRQITRSRTMLEYVSNESQILGRAKELLRGVEVEAQKVRLLGITLSNLDTETDEPIYRQMELELQLALSPTTLEEGVDWS
ncbi:DNA polymerase IV [Altericista sp. CCNU0014]|uniref:DNA polymerase IV n=1 Tax=Altericista sp. CCNU0014 TaxID=3082949 RepID=UPI0038511EAA